MFSFGRSSRRVPAAPWSQLLPLLEDDDRRAAVEREYPDPGREGFLKALGRVDADAAAATIAAGRQLDAAAPLAHYPTIAVAGMLNSGKTSLVAAFLSPAGRRRTLRGENNREGTHRFVLWLPSQWREDAEVWGLLLRRIGEALGQPPEMLAEDVDQAHAQYNNVRGGESALSVPLVAVDPALDSVGVGLLDCPDIVSDAAFGRGAPEARRQLLRKAATLCSAFVVVTGAESLRDVTLGDLLRIAAELMPGVPRMLAVNKVKPRLTPDSLWTNAQDLVKHHRIDALYAAYDYDVPASAPFIPKADPDRASDADLTAGTDEDPLPSFFRVSADPDENPPAAISPDRLLISLPRSLDHAELFEQVRVALESHLREVIWHQGVERLKEASVAAARSADQMRDNLLQATLDFFARREPGGRIAELRLHQSERIVRQLTQAFAEAAPWYARFGMKLNSQMRRLVGGANDLITRFTPSRVAESAARSIQENLRKGKQGSMLTPERLSDAIVARTSLDQLAAVATEEDLVHRGGQAIERFDAEDFTALDPSRLQQAVQEVWRQMPVKKKVKAGLTPLAILFAAFGAALMVPIDFGGSGVLFAASIKELLLAAGLSLAGAAWGGGLAIVDVEQQAARQQLSNFLAVLCDSLGIPRTSREAAPVTVTVAGQKVTLPEPTIRERPPTGGAMLQWHLRDEFLDELNKYVSRQ